MDDGGNEASENGHGYDLCDPVGFSKPLQCVSGLSAPGQNKGQADAGSSSRDCYPEIMSSTS